MTEWFWFQIVLVILSVPVAKCKDNSLTFFCLWIGDFKTHVSVGLAAIFELRYNSVSVETMKCTAVWQLQQFSMGLTVLVLKQWNALLSDNYSSLVWVMSHDASASIVTQDSFFVLSTIKYLTDFELTPFWKAIICSAT